ncbi:MAG: hypothetical protein RL033_1247, partial [Pseudomonadota bacterium]
MSDDRIDALAQRLFQAAREERPDAVLQERVRQLGGSARAATRGRLRPARLWLAAGALSAAAALWLLVGERTLQREPEVLISAEARPAAVGVERLPLPTVTTL